MRLFPGFVLFLHCLVAHQLASGAEILGLLRDNLGKGLSNFTVEAASFGATNFTFLETTTDAGGQFGFSGEAGSWQISVVASNLHQQGYFEVFPVALSVTETASVRFTTRKLDLNHRIVGRLVDELGQSLSGIPLQASIMENRRTFIAARTTEPDGSFIFPASPAIWRIAPPPGTSLPQIVFPDAEVVVEETNVETHVTLVAPYVTGAISGVASNLTGWIIVAQAQAYGMTYQVEQYLFRSSNFHLPVFNGPWTVFATNNGYFAGGLIPPPATTAFVTNDTVEAELHRTLPITQTLRVRTVTSNGSVVSNATVWASGESFTPVVPPPGPGPSPPHIELDLTPGHWRVTASTSGSNGVPSWQVMRQITITSNTAPPDLDLIFPNMQTDPRIVGTVRDCDGNYFPSQWFSIQTSKEETNYHAALAADTNAALAINILPGQWLVASSAMVCGGYTNISVSNLDVHADFILRQSPQHARIPVTVSVLDDSGPFAPGWQVSFRSGFDYLMTNISPSTPVTIELRPGIWDVSLSLDFYFGAPDEYILLPGMIWHLPEVPQTNLVLMARCGAARIEGRIRDEQGLLLRTGYCSARASVGGTNYMTSGSMSSGYFSINVFPGEWEVAASTWYYPSFNGLAGARAPGQPLRSDYTTPPPRIVSVTNGLEKCEFTVSNLPPSVALDVVVKHEDGRTLKGIEAWVSNALFTDASVDDDATRRFVVPPGQQTVYAYQGILNVFFETLLLPSLTLDVTLPTNAVNLVVRTPTKCLNGRITGALETTGLLPVDAQTAINGTNYTTSACPDCEGRFCLPVFPGVWTVSIPDEWLNRFGLRSVLAQEVVVPAQGDPPPVTFGFGPIFGDYRQSQLLTPTRLPDGTLQLELRTVAALTWRIERSADLIEWEPLTTVSTTNRVAHIFDTVGPAAGSHFYRAVWVR